MFFKVNTYKELIGNPQPTECIINVMNVLFAENRKTNWIFPSNCTLKGNDVMILWLNCTRGEFVENQETNRLTPQRLYIVGHADISIVENALLNFK